MTLIKPKALKKGDTIGVFAPSSVIYKEQPEQIKSFLEEKGYNVFIHPQCYSVDEQFAGTVDDKVSALHDLFLDQNIDAIFCTRGGNGAIHLLDKIDYDIIHQNPKIFMGYSDVTALLNAFSSKSNMFCFHGPMGTDFLPDKNEVTCNTVLDYLSGELEKDFLSYTDENKILNAGSVQGSLVGGNLVTLSALLLSGSQYMPDLTGAILVLEDVGEELSRMDRTLGGLRLAGVFDKIGGLIFGNTSIASCTSKSFPFGRSLEQVIRENTAGVDIPIIMNAPFGHEQPNIIFPIGAQAKLDATGSTSRLTLLESPFCS